MIDLVARKITLQGRTQDITGFQVWWQSPVGLFDKLEEAQAKVVELELDPRQMIVPVSVAIAADGTYEVIGR